jgi:hypothetical protein
MTAPVNVGSDGPAFIVIQSLSGLASASSLFIIASGLTIVFGVTRIVNFAHGSLYMLGAYLAVTIVPMLLEVDRSLPMFLLGVLLSALIVGVIGAAMEIILLRRIYHVPELFQLLATFGVVLIVQDLVIKLWGAVEIPGPRAPSLRHGVFIFDQRFPAYELFLIGMGLVVLGLLWLLMQKTRFGVLIRAATQDREMVGGARRQSGLAVHRHAVPWRFPGGPWRRAANPARRDQHADGHLDHHRGLRGHRDRRHGFGARRLHCGADHRAVAGLRHPHLPEDHAGAGVPAHGGGAGGQALGAVRQAGRGGGPRHPAGGHPVSEALRPASTGPRRPRHRRACWRCRSWATTTWSRSASR